MEMKPKYRGFIVINLSLLEHSDRVQWDKTLESGDFQTQWSGI